MRNLRMIHWARERLSRSSTANQSSQAWDCRAAPIPDAPMSWVGKAKKDVEPRGIGAAENRDGGRSPGPAPDEDVGLAVRRVYVAARHVMAVGEVRS